MQTAHQSVLWCHKVFSLLWKVAWSPQQETRDVKILWSLLEELRWNKGIVCTMKVSEILILG